MAPPQHRCPHCKAHVCKSRLSNHIRLKCTKAPQNVIEARPSPSPSVPIQQSKKPCVVCAHCKALVRSDRLLKHTQLRCRGIKEDGGGRRQSGPKLIVKIGSQVKEPALPAEPCPYCGKTISGARMLGHRSQCHFRSEKPPVRKSPPGERRDVEIIRCHCGRPSIPGETLCYDHKTE